MRRSSAIIAAVLALGMSQGPVPPPPRNAEEFERMFRELSNWGRWGRDDERGALNLVTAEKTRQAARLVRSGLSVSMAHEPLAETAPDNGGISFIHSMTDRFSDTYFFNYHGYVTTHIDALCHFSYNGMLYNGIPAGTNTQKGCDKLGIQTLKSGIVTRGVLIDIPRLKGVPYLEPGTPVYASDVEAWEKQAGMRVSSGDALILYTGRWARRQNVGPWPLPGPVAGFHVSVGRWIRERDVAVVGSDAATDVTPALFEGAYEPLHELLIAGLGVPILDALDLEALAATSARLKRWEFMLTVAPIPVTGGTGGPLNVLATF